MNDYYHKYIKYKTKYLEIKYGAGKREKKKAISVKLPQPVGTPVKLPQPVGTVLTSAPATPQQFSLTETPSSTRSDLSVSSNSADTDSPPQLKIEPKSLEILIENKDDLVCLLSSCPSLSDYDITSRPTTKWHLYINFKKKGDVSDFAHFSFHYPEEEEKSKIYDMFVANTFHLKLDLFPDIVFNLILDGDSLVLQSKMKPKNIIKKITKPNYDELVNIKNCLEKILNIPEYKKTIKEPVIRRLF